MSQTKKPFDLESFFRKRIKAAEDAGASQPWNEPDDSVWDQIDQALPERNPNRYRFLPWLIGIVFFGIILWLFAQNRALKNEIALLEKQGSEFSAMNDSQDQSPAETAKDETLFAPEADQPGQESKKIASAEGEKSSGSPAGHQQFNPSETEKTVQTGIQVSAGAGINNDGIQRTILSTGRKIESHSGNQENRVPPNLVSHAGEDLTENLIAGPILSEKAPGKRVESTVHLLSPSKISVPLYEREFQIPESFPNLLSTEPLRDQKNGWDLSISYEPSFAKLKNTTAYPDAPEFRGIDDLGVWSDAFSVRLTRELRSNLSVFAGIRYGAYRYQTAYYIALPYDPLLEVEGSDGNFTSDFSHSFPSPVGDMEASFGLLRLAEDEIAPQTILDLDLHARHRLKLVEIPFGISKSFNVTDRFSLAGSLSVIPGFVTGKESSAYAFESHHMAMHHRYSGFKGKTKSYNHLILSGGLDLKFAYRLLPQFSVFAGGGYQAGLTNVYSDLNVHSKIRAYRLSFGITNHF